MHFPTSLASFGRLVTPVMDLTHTYIGLPRSMSDPVPGINESVDTKVGAAAIYILAGMAPIFTAAAYGTYTDIRSGITHLRAGHTQEGIQAFGNAAKAVALSYAIYYLSKHIYF